jgi:hypothetical protein
MKKILLLLAFTSILSLRSVNGQSVITVSGDITSNTTWTNNNIYFLSGFVYVTNNAELTIEPGTLIKGDKASKGSLIVTRGAKLIADGTQSQPIVFTSNEPAGSRTYGDWGGIILCGRAPINDPAGEKVIEGGVDAVKGLYGGTDPADNSGILRYVRIEFPGVAFMPNNEINGLTCGGVGNGTTIDYIQVSYSGDDSYEWFGGNVNVKHLIAFRGLDDDFDTDYGFTGKCQFLVAMRDSNVADISGSNGFESDNDATGSTNTPNTQPIYSNVTLIGPMIDPSTSINANFKRAAHIRRSAKTTIFNSVLVGFPIGLLIDGTNCETNAANNDLQFQSNILAGCPSSLAVVSGSTWDITTWYNTPSFNNSILPNTWDVMLTDPNNYDNPDFMPMIGSPLLGTADFTNSALSNAFFDVVTYKGAFGANDWTAGWTNYDCENTNYATGINEVAVLKNLSIYPNPSSTNPRVNFTLEKVSDVKFMLYGVRGELIDSKEMGRLETGSHDIQIPYEHLSGGMYTLRILAGSNAFSTKFSIK